MIEYNSRKFLVRGLLLATLLLYSNAGISALSGDSRWLVEKGDSVYSIARNVFPGDADKQRQFRQELVASNPGVFKKGVNNMSVGTQLVLPAFAVSKPVAVTKQTLITKPEPVIAAIEPVAEKKMVTADPEDVIGHVVVSVGNMQASNRGVSRKLLRHSEVLRGDTISTSKRTYTQIRMKDGALMSLRPNTELKITDYRFNGKEDGSERSIMELISGGFRTITGLIGHRNKQNYRVKTSVATIGIRGTHYALMVCAQGSCSDESAPLEDGVYGGVVDGSIVVENQSGIATFNNDQYFHVASLSDTPVEQLLPPPVFHGKNETQKSAKNDDWQRSPAGKKRIRGDRLGTLAKSIIEDRSPPPILSDQVTDVIKDQPLVNLAPVGSGMLLAFSATSSITGARDTISAPVLVGIADNAIVLGSKVAADGTAIANLPIGIRENANGALHEVVLPSGVSGITDIGGHALGVNWGRWSDNFAFMENGVFLQTFGDLHFIYSDNLTTPTQLAALGGLTTLEIYALAGNTTPTNKAGQAVSLLGVSVTSDFVNQKIVDYQIAVKDSVLDPVAPMDLSMQASNIPFSQMSEFSLTATANCSVGCTGSAGAAFVGNQAEGLITSYSVQDTAGTNVINGTAFLIRESATPLP